MCLAVLSDFVLRSMVIAYPSLAAHKRRAVALTTYR